MKPSKFVAKFSKNISILYYRLPIVVKNFFDFGLK